MSPKKRESVSPIKERDGKQTGKMDTFLTSPGPAMVGRSKNQGKNVNVEEGVSGVVDPSALKMILEAVGKCNSSIEGLTAQVGTIGGEIALIREDLKGIRERCSEVEGRVSTLEDVIVVIKEQMRKVLDTNQSLEKKVTDLEDRSRRNNLRIVGVPEGSKGKDVIKSLREWINTILSPVRALDEKSIERAHRIPLRTLPPGSNPRTMIVKFLSSQDRDSVLKAGREKKDLMFSNNEVAIFPDYAMETQRKRTRFKNVKKRLYQNGVKFSLMFPARIKIIYNKKTFFFITQRKQQNGWMPGV